MPSLSNEQIEEINYYLNKAIESDINLKIRYFNNNKIHIINGHVTKINKNQKYIMIDNTKKILFKEIIQISA